MKISARQLVMTILLILIIGIVAFGLWSRQILEDLGSILEEHRILQELNTEVGTAVTAVAGRTITGEVYRNRLFREIPAVMERVAERAFLQGWGDLGRVATEVSETVRFWERVSETNELPQVQNRLQAQTILALVRTSDEVSRLQDRANREIEEVHQESYRSSAYVILLVLFLSAVSAALVLFAALAPLAKVRRRVAEGRPLRPYLPRGLIASEVTELAAAHDKAMDQASVEIESRAEAEEALAEALRQKTLLLQEVHHRTKNGLQIIRSIINLKARLAPENSELQELASDVSNRILAISLVHQKLFRSHELTKVNGKEYLQELVAALESALDVASQGIDIRCEVEELTLGLDDAIGTGLMVTELITNAVKYAFSERDGGSVLVRLREADGRLELRVSDDGVGLPEGFDLRRHASLGLQTVFQIAEDQLDGEVSLKSNGGVTFSVHFPN
jgi:two-component sensor histidine kinase